MSAAPATQTARAPQVVASAADLGRIVRSRRRELGFTQLELAEGSGVGITFVSNLERGKGSSEIDKALRVAVTLGIDLVARERG